MDTDNGNKGEIKHTIMNKYSNYEPLTEDEGKALYFKVEALERLVKDIALIVKENVDKDSNTMRIELQEAIESYNREINED
jgi:hypothetical protein